MKLNLTDTLYALSFALDAVQYEMGGVSNNHGKHVAYISYLIGKELKYKNDLLNDLMGLAILHDNAFTEYIREEYNEGKLFDYNELANTDLARLRVAFLTKSRHNIVGEMNIRLIPFETDTKTVILYHHENADGTGPFNKKADEVSELSQIIHIADMMDVMFDLRHMKERQFNDAMAKMENLKDKMFSAKMVEALKRSVTYEDIKVIQEGGVIPYLKSDLRTSVKDYTDEEIKGICEFFAQIVDYKSSVTKSHSLGVADKCYKMAKYYNFDDDKAIRLYFAGAFHDIGKLIINNDILEKPSSLNEKEFEKIKDHAKATEVILSQIEGIEDIAKWASHHHERLDGTGYPYGYKKEDLSFEERLLACVDVYQALTEKRSYKDKIVHHESIKIMKEMAIQGKLDMDIINDIDHYFAIILED